MELQCRKLTAHRQGLSPSRALGSEAMKGCATTCMWACTHTAGYLHPLTRPHPTLTPNHIPA